MSTGCPPGSHGKSCDLCPLNQWKSKTTNETTSCTSCPFQTTTSIRAATAKNQCDLCIINSPNKSNGSCSVDLSNQNFVPTWHCFGTFGDQCQHPCKGGAESPCRGNGKCSDGIHGNGTCTCDFPFIFAGNDCNSTFTLILLSLLGGAIPLVV